MKPSDLLWLMASRAKGLANMPMPLLRKASEYEGLDLGDGSRGAIIEAVLGEEFEDQFKAFDDMAEDVERERTDR